MRDLRNIIADNGGDPRPDPTTAATIKQLEKERCKLCIANAGQMYPPHFASTRCESGGYNHCSCDTCF